MLPLTPLKLLQSFQHIFWGFEGAVFHARRCNSRKNTRVSRGIDTMCKKSACTCTRCQASPSFFCKKSTCFSPTFLLFSFFIEKKSILSKFHNEMRIKKLTRISVSSSSSIFLVYNVTSQSGNNFFSSVSTSAK